MSSVVLSCIDLLSLLWAWVYQWWSILAAIYVQILVRVEGPSAATPSSDFWYAQVFVGVSGILVTNFLGASHFYHDNRFFLCGLAAVDLDTPYLVLTQAQAYSEGRSPDLRRLRRRNALWRGLPCAAVSVFVGFRAAAQTTVCQHVAQFQQMMDPEMSIEFKREHGVYLYPLSSQLWRGHEDDSFGKWAAQRVGTALTKRFPGGKCPAANRVIRPVTAFKEFVAVTGTVAARAEDVQPFKGLSALQVSLRDTCVDVLSRGIHDSFPSLEPLLRLGASGTGKTVNKAMDDMLINVDNGVRRREWNHAGADRAFVVTYSDSHTTWLLLQAAFQLLVAVKGLTQHVREQRKLPFIGAAALYIHLVMDAFLVIGCLFILFDVMPNEWFMSATVTAVLREVQSIASGPLLDRLVRLAHLLIFEDEILSKEPPPSSQGRTYLHSEVLPLLQPTIARLADAYFDGVHGVFTPDLGAEQLMLGKVVVIAGVLYGLLYGVLSHVGPHVFVTSPAALLAEEGAQTAETVNLVVQMALKSCVVLMPYVIAARGWLEFKLAVAMQSGVYMRSIIAYHIALVLYVAILIIAGIVAVAHYGRDGAMPDDGRSEELHVYPPQQGCCAVDRKRHKPAADALAMRAAIMEAGAGQRLLGQASPGYSAC
jgi:hypothetical protein